MAEVGKNYQAQARTGPGVATPLISTDNTNTWVMSYEF